MKPLEFTLRIVDGTLAGSSATGGPIGDLIALDLLALDGETREKLADALHDAADTIAEGRSPPDAGAELPAGPCRRTVADERCRLRNGHRPPCMAAPAGMRKAGIRSAPKILHQWCSPEEGLAGYCSCGWPGVRTAGNNVTYQQKVNRRAWNMHARGARKRGEKVL
jgi:hypothetical protein